jgi:hypothetical protein
MRFPLRCHLVGNQPVQQVSLGEYVPLPEPKDRHKMQMTVDASCYAVTRDDRGANEDLF